MRHLKEKIRIIFLPFLLLGCVFIPCYALVRWLVDVRLALVALDDMLWGFAFPAGLSCLLMLIFLRRRLKILLLPKGTLGHVMLGALAIAVPAIIASNYVSLAAYDLQHVRDVRALKAGAYQRFYVIDSYKVDTLRQYFYYKAVVSGKHDENLTYHCYVVMPLQGAATDADSSIKAWYGQEYTSSLSNRLSDALKDSAYRAFDAHVGALVRSRSYDSGTYFENVPFGSDRAGYLDAIALCKQPTVEHPCIFTVKDGDFSQRMSGLIPWVFGAWGIGLLLFLVVLLVSRVGLVELDRYQHHLPANEDDLRDFLGFAVPRGRHFTTSLLIWLNVIWYLVMVFNGVDLMSPTGNEVLPYGAITEPLFRSGDRWRALSAIFVHFGFAHLAYNMIGLAISGVLLEGYIGRYWLLAVYLLTGVLASICGVAWGGPGVHAGASGAIFGLYGVLAGLLLLRAIPASSSGVVLFVLIIYAGASLVIGFMTPNVGNTAHVSGLVAGAVCGMILALLKQVRPDAD